MQQQKTDQKTRRQMTNWEDICIPERKKLMEKWSYETNGKTSQLMEEKWKQIKAKPLKTKYK